MAPPSSPLFCSQTHIAFSPVSSTRPMCYVDFKLDRDKKLMVLNHKTAGDQYTPQYVRFADFLKEGLCEHCDPPRWYKLKTSNYWYHVQFNHGISHRTGKPFALPSETRKGEGLCPICKKWVPLDSKGAPAFHWFKHMHLCSRGQR